MLDEPPPVSVADFLEFFTNSNAAAGSIADRTEGALAPHPWFACLPPPPQTCERISCGPHNINAYYGLNVTATLIDGNVANWHVGVGTARQETVLERCKTPENPPVTIRNFLTAYTPPPR